MTDETQRIRFLIQRDGEATTREWVGRTLDIYRKALASADGHAPTPQYRPLFEQAIRQFEQWLRDHAREAAMAPTSAESGRAREVVGGLLEELHLDTYTFDVEPRDDGWAIQVECAADDGWMTRSLTATRDELWHGTNARMRQQLLDAWARPLAHCRRTR
ncbi:hypothetical protein [Thioalkalivibrio nitratireducens]|nr:hypothetical protein [Thioalkalivibrio nitratireducens]